MRSGTAAAGPESIDMKIYTALRVAPARAICGVAKLTRSRLLRAALRASIWTLAERNAAHIDCRFLLSINLCGDPGRQQCLSVLLDRKVESVSHIGAPARVGAIRPINFGGTGTLRPAIQAHLHFREAAVSTTDIVTAALTRFVAISRVMEQTDALFSPFFSQEMRLPQMMIA